MKDLKIAVGKLREEINALAKESRALADQRRILKAQGPSTGPERSMLWSQRKAIGQQARIAILASGLLRGRPHWRMERNRRPYDWRSYSAAIALKLLRTFGQADQKTRIWDPSLSPYVSYVSAWFAVEPEGAKLPEAAE